MLLFFVCLFFILATTPYILGNSDAASVFIWCCWCIHNTGHQRWPVSSFLSLFFFFFVQQFLQSLFARKQTVSPPELLESNLIALHFPPAWLPLGANSKPCTYSVLCLCCFSSGAEERPWAFQRNMRTSPLASHVFTWTLIQNRPSIPKVNARAAFVGVCRCNPPPSPPNTPPACSLAVCQSSS